MHPRATERVGTGLTQYVLYSADFSVACDSCRVAYGREDALFHDVTDGSWDGRADLGTLRSGDKVRVVLRIRPIGEARILSAEIRVNGASVASCEEKKPGKSVDLWARVGPL